LRSQTIKQCSGLTVILDDQLCKGRDKVAAVKVCSGSIRC
jgi:hypothetical protein